MHIFNNQIVDINLRIPMHMWTWKAYQHRLLRMVKYVPSGWVCAKTDGGTAYCAYIYFVWRRSRLLLDRATIHGIHILRIVVMMDTLFVL
jgi:hypothetical protein